MVTPVLTPGIAFSFDEPYFDPTSAQQTTIPPPSPWPVSLAGWPLMADTSFEPYRRDAFRHRSIPAQRDSISLNNEPGEGTVNTEGLWRRGMDDWSLGAGQFYLDRKESVSNRFYQSKGINPFNQWNLTLHFDTKRVYAPPGDSILKTMTVGNAVWILEPTRMTYTQDWVTFTEVLPILFDAGFIPDPVPDSNINLALGTMFDFCTDGYMIWIACAGGIYTITGEAPNFVGSVYITDNTRFDTIAFVSDRLLASSGNRLYNITHGYQAGVLTSGGLTSGTTYTSIDISPAPQEIQNLDTVFIGDQAWTTTSSAAVGATSVSVSSAAADANYPAGTLYTVRSWASVGGPDSWTSQQLLWQHPSPQWLWHNYAEGSSQIYIGGAVGFYGPGAVYRTTLNADNITLAVPVIALPMEGGEYPTSLFGYLNFIFVGSNYGIRMCQTLAAYDPSGNQGDLRAGSLIPNITQPVTQPVTAITASGRYVWFTWNDYDSKSTGLGRLDLATFIDALSPVYASDLMITAQGWITSLDWDPITAGPVMGMANGVYVEDRANVVPSGTIDSGRVTFGIPDDKIARFLDARQNASGGGSVSFALELDSAAPFNVGQIPPSVGRGTLSISQLRAENFNVLATLTSGGGLSAPDLERWTLKALPGVVSGTEISVVIDCAEKITLGGVGYEQDPYAIYTFVRGLHTSQTVVSYVEGGYTAMVTVDSFDWLPNKMRDNYQGGYNSYLVAYLKTLMG